MSHFFFLTFQEMTLFLVLFGDQFFFFPPSFFLFSQVSVERLYYALFSSLAFRVFLSCKIIGFKGLENSLVCIYDTDIAFQNCLGSSTFSRKMLLLQKMKFPVKFGWKSLYSIRNIKLKMSVLHWAESHLNFNWGKAERLVSCRLPTALLTFLCLKNWLYFN